MLIRESKPFSHLLRYTIHCVLIRHYFLHTVITSINTSSPESHTHHTHITTHPSYHVILHHITRPLNRHQTHPPHHTRITTPHWPQPRLDRVRTHFLSVCEGFRAALCEGERRINLIPTTTRDDGQKSEHVNETKTNEGVVMDSFCPFFLASLFSFNDNYYNALPLLQY